jgi:hypothetical protein
VEPVIFSRCTREINIVLIDHRLTVVVPFRETFSAKFGFLFEAAAQASSRTDGGITLNLAEF